MARSTSDRPAARSTARSGPRSLTFRPAISHLLTIDRLSLADCFHAACHSTLLQDDDDIAGDDILGDDGSDCSELLSGDDILEDDDSDCSDVSCPDIILTEENPDGQHAPSQEEEEVRRLEAQVVELQALELDQVRALCLCPCRSLFIYAHIRFMPASAHLFGQVRSS